jgi:hypothetical protein
MNTQRQALHPFPLEQVALASGQLIITMSTGQWDAMLATAYEDGWILLELNDREIPVRAYRRPVA